MPLLIKFRSTYRGVAEYDVFGRDAKRHAIISVAGNGPPQARLTEHGESARLSGPAVIEAFTVYQAEERAKFLRYCEKNGLDPSLAD